MLKKMALSLLVLLTLLPTFSLTRAQSSSTPLIILMDGDLWAWSGSALEQLTTWGYNQRPVISPDGRYVAYNSWAQLTVDAINGGEFIMGDAPSNIWVIDLMTDEVIRLVDQPAGATFTSGRAVLRSDPEWSPDGKFLAWVEINPSTDQFQLVTYDFVNRTSRVIVSELRIPFMDAGVFVGSVKWGAGGIIYEDGSFNGATANFEQTLWVYDPNGQVISSTLVADSSRGYLADYFWVDYPAGASQIALLYDYGNLALLNPATSAIEVVAGTSVALSNAQAPVSLSISLNMFTAEGNNPGVLWQIAGPGDGTLPLEYEGNSRWKQISISPDGLAVAYIADGVYVWRDGQAQRIPGTENITASENFPTLAWSYETWLVWGNGGLGGDSACTPLQPRLALNQAGVVLPGEPNAIRGEPRTGSDNATLGSIPAGGIFRVVAGPQCGSGYTWWQVDYQGVVGWTPEGENQTYWLSPLVCDNAPISRLVPNSSAQVIPNTSPNAIRNAPGGGQVIGNIPAGGVFSVRNRYECGADGRGWWEIDYNGTAGWTAEGEGSTYWIEPIGG